MAIVYGALLTKDNYESFRRVLTDAPPTFEKWNHRRNERATDTLSKRWELVEVEIDLQDYIRDCDATHTEVVPFSGTGWRLG